MVKNRTGMSLFVLRIVLGAIFIAHGWAKLQGIGMVIGFFGSLGLAPVFAYAIAWVEFISGLALLLGIFTRIAGYLIAATMVVAIILVKHKMGFLGGYELDVILLASALTIAWSGPGVWCIPTHKKVCDLCEMCKSGCTKHEGK